MDTYYQRKNPVKSFLLLIAGMTFAHLMRAQELPAPRTNATSTDSLETIVVTAEKIGVSELQKTPIAIAVFSEGDLDRSKINNIEDLVSYTPSLTVAQTTASPQIFIRGVGTSYVGVGSDPDVTMQVDGVYMAHAFDEFGDFLDIGRIEVLRGPQGTLYGRNAVGGTINVISRVPTDKFQLKEQLTVGDFSLIQNQAYISGPLVAGKLQGSLSGNYISRDPYVDNIVTGQRGVGSANRWGVRGQLRVLAKDNVEAITRVDYASSNEYYDGYTHLLAPVRRATRANSLLGDFTKVALGTSQPIATTNKGISEEINVKFTDAFALKSLTAYRESSFDLVSDTDATELPINTTTQAESAQQFTQEFDFIAKMSRFKGVLGAYFFTDHDKAAYTILTSPPPAPLLKQSLPVSNSTSWAVYGQGTFDLTPTVSAIVGGRYTRDVKSVDADLFANIAPAFPSPTPLGPSISLPGFPLPFIASTSRTYDSFTPKFGLNWQATPHAMLYVSATEGYKSGGTNLSAFSLAALNYGPEKLWSYEGGVKSDWYGERLRVNLTAFRYDYTGLQVQSALGNGLGVVINNAASATVNGFEAEITAKPTPGLLLTANVSLLDGTYGQFPNASVSGAAVPYISVLPCYTPPAGPTAPAFCNAAGNRLNNAPTTSFSLLAQYTHKFGFGSLYGRTEYYNSSRVYYDPSNVQILSQAPYDLLNLSVGYTSRDGNWDVAVIGNDVSHTRYFITVAANGSAPAGLPGPPRTIAGRVTFRF